MRRVKLPKSQIFCFFLITIICIIAIMEAVYFVMNPDSIDNSEVSMNSLGNNTVDYTSLIKNFDDLFKNQFENTSTSLDVDKIDINNDYVYTGYEKKEISSGNYEIDVKIPVLNINSEEIKSYNEEIKRIFQEKAESVLNGESNRTIYSVDYEAFLNNNIFSIVIKATLKEGSDPQREIIQTYCYNIKDMKKVEFSDLMQLKNLDTNTVENKIKQQIQGKQEEAKSLQQLGYSVYIRDLRSDRYEVENITNFFIDNQNNIYVIYAYGNTTNTDVTDIIIF